MKLMYFIRHCKPVLEQPTCSIGYKEFKNWIKDYKNSSVSNQINDNYKVIEPNIIVSSPKIRAERTANIFFPNKKIRIEKVLDSVPLVTPTFPFIKMSLKRWIRLGRFLFSLGFKGDNGETKKEVGKRLDKAIDMLLQSITHTDSIAIVGHWCFNDMLIKKLVNKGWSGDAPGRCSYGHVQKIIK